MSGTAACWICLEGGDDEKGKPLVRDCACRGSDAGFAHMSCIIKYATQKSEQSMDSHGFFMQWVKCPNCNQTYQSDLAVNLSAAFVSYATETYVYPENDLVDKIKVMEALKHQIQANRRCALIRGEMVATRYTLEELIHRLLAMVDQAKVEHDMDEWEHMAPTSFEFQHYCHIKGNYEAFGYLLLGELYSLVESGASTNIENSYYEKAREICNSIGDTAQAKSVTECVDHARAKSEGDKAGQLKAAKEIFFSRLEEFGENAEETLQTGLSYALRLRTSDYSIQAERLAMKLSATSHQVYGKDHICTKRSLRIVNDLKRRFIHMFAISPESLSKGFEGFEPFQYEALQYENDGKSCIITGPIKDPKKDNDEEERKTFSIANTLFFPGVGCPVICRGLINASHLNGKLGDVRSLSVASGCIRLGVHFEDESLKPAAVKPGNLSIAFVLPSSV